METTYNIGLLNDRQNIVYLSGILFLSGVVLLGFGFVTKEEMKNLKSFALWTFLTPIAFLIGMKVVADIQEANRQEAIAKAQKEIRLQIAEETAREVNAKLKENSDKFIDNKDGTVTFKANSLMWQRCSVGQNWTGATCEGDAKKFTWDDAMTLTSNFAGHSDWRVPTKDELMTLVYCSDGNSSGSCTLKIEIKTTYEAAINTTYFPNMPRYSLSFWSASPYAGNSDYAWYVDFGYGNSYYYGKNDSNSVRLVR